MADYNPNQICVQVTVPTKFSKHLLKSLNIGNILRYFEKSVYIQGTAIQSLLNFYTMNETGLQADVLCLVMFLHPDPSHAGSPVASVIYSQRTRNY